jgi:hypothetical protein
MTKLYADGLTLKHLIERVEYSSFHHGISWKGWKKASNIIEAFADNINNIERPEGLSQADVYNILRRGIRDNKNPVEGYK